MGGVLWALCYGTAKADSSEPTASRAGCACRASGDALRHPAILSNAGRKQSGPGLEVGEPGLTSPKEGR